MCRENLCKPSKQVVGRETSVPNVRAVYSSCKYGCCFDSWWLQAKQAIAKTSKMKQFSCWFASWSETQMLQDPLFPLSYSMGGFGAFQLGGFAPDVFDVVISVAGYGLGTLEPEGRLVSSDESKGCWRLDVGSRESFRRSGGKDQHWSANDWFLVPWPYELQVYKLQGNNLLKRLSSHTCYPSGPLDLAHFPC